MSGQAAAYLVAFGAMLFAGISALTLIFTVNHLDLPQTREADVDVEKKVPV